MVRARLLRNRAVAGGLTFDSRSTARTGYSRQSMTRPPYGTAVSARLHRLLLALVGLFVVWTFAVPTQTDAIAVDAVAVDDGQDSDCQDCPEDDEDGECPPGCDACTCCPAAASLAMGTGERHAACAARPTTERRFSDSGQPMEGARSRVFRPPRPSIS